MPAPAPGELKVWTKESIQELLGRSNLAVERAIVAIYKRQTQEEQVSGGTKERNGMGFGAYDSEYLTRVAQGILGGTGPGKWYIEKFLRPKVLKYWRQLAEIANQNEIEKSQTRDQFIWAGVEER